MSIRYVGEGVFLFLGEESRFDSLVQSHLWEEIPTESVPPHIREEMQNRMDAFGLGRLVRGFGQMRGPNQSRQTTGQNERGQTCWAPNKPCGKACKPTCDLDKAQGPGQRGQGGRKINKKTMIAARAAVFKKLKQVDPKSHQRLLKMDPKVRDRHIDNAAKRYVAQRRRQAAKFEADRKAAKASEKTMIAARATVFKDMKQNDPDGHKRLLAMDPKARSKEIDAAARKYISERLQQAAKYKGDSAFFEEADTPRPIPYYAQTGLPTLVDPFGAYRRD